MPRRGSRSGFTSGRQIQQSKSLPIERYVKSSLLAEFGVPPEYYNSLQVVLEEERENSALFLSDSDSESDGGSETDTKEFESLPLSPSRLSGRSYSSSTPPLSPISVSSSQEGDRWPAPAIPFCGAFLCVYDLDDDDEASHSFIPPAPNWQHLLPFGMNQCFLDPTVAEFQDVCCLFVVAASWF